jgi:hypothetical protein
VVDTVLTFAATLVALDSQHIELADEVAENDGAAAAIRSAVSPGPVRSDARRNVCGAPAARPTLLKRCSWRHQPQKVKRHCSNRGDGGRHHDCNERDPAPGGSIQLIRWNVELLRERRILWWPLPPLQACVQAATNDVTITIQGVIKVCRRHVQVANAASPKVCLPDGCQPRSALAEGTSQLQHGIAQHPHRPNANPECERGP